ncbi:protein of unknown function [Mesotoga infera]|uniref:Uncharacterized protein n=1 Tax=Mesotoga infera TaxID=1236046 RepID=A0A7Z7LE96_9BACT|nr:protein of unknown function [Mesotoga infera]
MSSFFKEERNISDHFAAVSILNRSLFSKVAMYAGQFAQSIPQKANIFTSITSERIISEII